MYRPVVLALVLLSCSRQTQTAPDASSVDAEPKAASVDTIDQPKATKKAEGVSVTFLGANGSNGTPATKKDPGATAMVGMVFQVENTTDEERRIVGEMDAQAMTLAGISGEHSQEPTSIKQCMGIAPPHGRFMCSLIYQFGAPGSEAPRELRARMAGAWFHIVVNVKDAR